LAKKYRANKDFGVKISGETVFRCVALMIQQLVEKIDRTRLIAGSLLQDLVDNYLRDLPEFKGLDKVQAIFNKENIQKKLQAEQDRLETNFSLSEEIKGKNFSTISTQQMNFDDVNLSNTEGFIYYWNLPHCVYPLITPLLETHEFSYYILKGLIISVGGLTESINKHSYTALMDYLEYISQQESFKDLLMRLFDEFILLLRENVGDERVVIPLFKTLERVFEKDEVLFEKENLQEKLLVLYELISKEIAGTKSVQKLITGVSTLVNMMRFELRDVSYKVLGHSTAFLLNKYPVVRKTFIDKLYFYLMMNGEDALGEELNEKVSALLTEHEWFEMPLAELKSMKETVEPIFKEFRAVFGETEPTQ